MIRMIITILCLILAACAHMGKEGGPGDTAESPSLGIGVRTVRVPKGFQDKGVSHALKIVSVRTGSSAQAAGLRTATGRTRA